MYLTTLIQTPGVHCFQHFSEHVLIFWSVIFLILLSRHAQASARISAKNVMFCFCLVGWSVSCIVFQCLSDSVFVVIQGLDSYGLHIRYIRSALVRNKGCILCVAVVACDVKGTSHEKCSPWFLLKMLQMLAEPSYSILSREAEYCDAFVCVSVCPRVHLELHVPSSLNF